MAEGTEPAQGTEGTEQGTEGDTPDYKALYEEAKRHARDWEKKAKGLITSQIDTAPKLLP